MSTMQVVAWLTDWTKDRVRPKGAMLSLAEPAVRFEENSYHALVKQADALAAIKALEADRDEALAAQERYRHVRRLSPRAFTEIHMRNISGEGLFDDLIDQDMEARAEAIRATFPKEAT